MALAFSYRGADPDLWGHVQYGRDAWSAGLSTTATYTYTAEGYRWINHEHFSELLFAWLVDHFGIQTLLVLKTLLGVGIITLVAWNARRADVGWPVVIMAAAMVVGVLCCYWLIRPQIFSYALFAALVWLMTSACSTGPRSRAADHLTGRAADPQRFQPQGSMRRLVFAPGLLMIWANTHGAFVAGLAVFVAYVMLRGVEALWHRRSDGIRPFLGMTVLAAAAGLATVVNPYGLQLPCWLVRALSVPRPEIMEWHPLRVDHAVFLPAAVLVLATAAGIAASRRPRDLTQCILLALVLWQGIRHHRHLPFFAILAGFWLPAHWQSAWQGWTPRASAQAPTSSRPLRLEEWSLGLWGATAVLVCLLIPRWSHVVVERREYPVTAIQFLRDRELHGRMVVTFNWAQYAIAALCASDRHDPTSVGFDGRFRTCYPQIVIDEHFDFILGYDGTAPRYRDPRSPPPQAAAVLTRGHPELVLISRRQPHSVFTMAGHADQWTLLYQDRLAQVWGRRSLFDDPQSPRYLPPERRSLTDTPQTGWVAWPALPQKSAAELVSEDRSPATSPTPRPSSNQRVDSVRSPGNSYPDRCS